MKLFYLLFFISSIARADLLVGAGVGKGVIYREPFERVFSVAYQRPLDPNVFVRLELGGWLGGPGVSSPFASVVFGVQVAPEPKGVEAHISLGPTFLLNHDEVLGGHYQFNFEFGFGIKDKKMYIGPVYKHFSSAGLEMPNLGRDFMMLQLRVLSSE